MGAHALMFAVLETTCRTSAPGFKRIPQTCTYNGVYLRSVPFDVVYVRLLPRSIIAISANCNL